MDEIDAPEPRRRARKRDHATGLTLILLIALVALWLQRRPIATDLIDRELGRRGVRASYDVTDIGFRTQRLENVVIGDPARPDLVARRVEVRIAVGLGAPRVAGIFARGVRIRGRLVDGALSLGELDKLMPPPSGAPFRLPDQYVDVADTSIRLDTPAGAIGIAIEGKGRLSDGFRGRIAARSPRLRLAGCVLEAPRVDGALSTRDERPTLDGPLAITALACDGGVRAREVRLPLEATLAPGLDGWIGRSGIAAAAVGMGGNRLSDVSGRVTFAGDRERTRGSLELAAGPARVSGIEAGGLRLEGGYEAFPDSGRLVLAADLGGQRMHADRSLIAPALGALAGAEGTPLGPIGVALSSALTGAASDFSGSAAVRLDTGASTLRVERADVSSASGATLGMSGGEGVSYRLDTGALRLDSAVRLAGGGFPESEIRLASDSSGALSGTGRIGAMAAGGAQVELGRIDFSPLPGGGTRIATVARLDGPIPGGRVDGLLVPIRGRIGDGFAFGEDCTPVSFRALRASGLTLGATRLSLCPTGRALVWAGAGGAIQGGGAIDRLRLAGRLGENPIAIEARRARFAMADASFALDEPDVALGVGGEAHRLAAGSLSGRIVSSGVAGALAGMEGKLANVPLLLSEGEGRWGVEDGDLAVEGSIMVADAVEPRRFEPLRSDDFQLTMEGDDIRATGALRHPASGTLVANATIRHDLARGAGDAVLDVPGIAFTPQLQPEALTRLTLGVVALVDGVVKGKGEIGWSPEGTSSSGAFSTEDMDLAAAFGPVEGLSTTIRFTDLLGLATAPGQTATVDRIQAGIDVFDGELRYQLLPDLRVKVESGRWPFAGGTLALEETILDFSKPSEKHLTFRVDGLDAAAFIQQLEFGNISATGTFDGVVPMVFDDRGGRIVGGRLVARESGGTLSYVGELSDKDLGAYGKLAFDALKSLRYNKLTIDLNGALDGEFVAGIELDGIARDPTLTALPAGSGISGIVAGRALGQLAKIPFEFNINVRGPFRALIATARSFEDPSLLIQQVLPDRLRELPAAAVQPQESEDVR